MRVQCQDPPQAPHPHHLEADRISQTQALLPESPQPPVHGGALKVTIHEHHLVRRILIETVKKPQAFGGAAKATEQNLHLGHHQVGGDEPLAAFDPRNVGGPRFLMMRLLWAEGGKTPRVAREWSCGSAREFYVGLMNTPADARLIERIEEIAREIGTLLLVFAPLDAVVGDYRTQRSWMLLFFALGIFFTGVALTSEYRRQNAP